MNPWRQIGLYPADSPEYWREERMLNLEEIFEKHKDEFLKFDRIEKRHSQRKDLHAFILLDRLVPGGDCIVSASEHDEFWIDVDREALAEVATEEQIIELIRCGVRLDAYGLQMFS